MAIVIKNTVLSSNLRLTECTDGFWLYDETRGMNLAMQVKTEQDAFIEAITYYQNRLSEVESEYRKLERKVDNFLEQLKEDE